MLDRILSAQGDGSRLAIELGARVEEVRKAQDRGRRQLLRQDSRPLWSALPPRGEDTAPASLPVEAPPERFDATAQYLAAHAGRVRLHLALFVLAALLLWWVGGRRNEWATAEFAIHWPSDLLDHPIAAGLVLALLFARPLYLGAPQGVLGLAFLVMLPGLVILLRPLLARQYRAPAYVLVGLWGGRPLGPHGATTAEAA